MFTLLAIGDWSIEQIHVRRSNASRRIVPAVESLIDAEWTKLSQRPGVKLFDGPMAQLVSFGASVARLNLEISQTSYKPFVGTNMTHPELIAAHGRKVMADPLGVAPLIVSADGFLVLGHRSSSMALYPNRIHPFGGTMDPKDPGPAQAALREMHEELGLDAKDIADLRCVGLAEDNAIRQPEMIFYANARCARDELIEKLDADEHHAAWSIPAEAKAVADALKTEAALTPIACSGMLLWGRVRFGQAWFDAQSKIKRL